MTPNEIYREALNPVQDEKDSLEAEAARKLADFKAALAGWNNQQVTRDLREKLLARRQELIINSMQNSFAAVTENGIWLRRVLTEAATLSNVLNLMETGEYGNTNT